MAEKRAASTNMTRSDKAHKKFMDKLNVLRDNVNHRIKEKEVNGHIEFLKEEREKTDRNITGGMILVAVAGGLISNKQVRQMSGKAISSVGKSLLRLKK